MGLKIDRKTQIITKVVGFSLLGILIIILAKIFIWELGYYQTKTVETRPGEQQIVLEIGDPEMPVETEPSEKDIKNHRAPSNAPRYITLNDKKSRVISIAIESNVMQTPDNIYDVNWYANTGNPGEGKNIFMNGIIAGETAEGAFSGLSELQKGTEITIENGEGAKFNYAVKKNETIDREEAKTVLPKLQTAKNDKETLTLMALTRKSPESTTLDAIILVQAKLK